MSSRIKPFSGPPPFSGVPTASRPSGFGTASKFGRSTAAASPSFYGNRRPPTAAAAAASTSSFTSPFSRFTGEKESLPTSNKKSVLSAYLGNRDYEGDEVAHKPGSALSANLGGGRGVATSARFGREQKAARGSGSALTAYLGGDRESQRGVATSARFGREQNATRGFASKQEQRKAANRGKQ